MKRKEWETRYLGSAVDWDSVGPEVRDSRGLMRLLKQALEAGWKQGAEELFNAKSWESVLRMQGTMKAFGSITRMLEDLESAITEDNNGNE